MWDRTTFSLEARHEPYEWLTHRAIMGGDFTVDRRSELYRTTGREPPGQFTPWGRKTVINLSSSYFSLDYQANVPLTFGDFSLTTSGGAQYYQRREESTRAHGETFPVEALETVTSGAEKQAAEDFLENKTFGVSPAGTDRLERQVLPHRRRSRGRQQRVRKELRLRGLPEAVSVVRDQRRALLSGHGPPGSTR